MANMFDEVSDMEFKLFYKATFGNKKNIYRYIAELRDRERRNWMIRTGQEVAA